MAYTKANLTACGTVRLNNASAEDDQQLHLHRCLFSSAHRFVHIVCKWQEQSHNIITSTGLNLINCNTSIIPHHPHCCYVYIPGTTYLHILLHYTLYLIAHLTPYFISLFVSYFILTIFIYIYSLVFCFIVFIAFMLFLFNFFCTFHWADLSWLTFHFLLYPVWLCMWQIIKNLEPWAANAGLYLMNSVFCSLHFTADPFTNKALYDTGFSERLKQKDDAVPSILNPTVILQHTSVTLYYVVAIALSVITDYVICTEYLYVLT